MFLKAVDAMLSESEELIDAAYSATYRAATFQGNFNPETGKAYADEAVQLFGMGTVSENEGGNKSSNVINRSGPVVKTKANTISNLGRTAKKKKKSRDNGSISKANAKRGISAKQEYMMDISNAGEVAGKIVKVITKEKRVALIDMIKDGEYQVENSEAGIGNAFAMVSHAWGSPFLATYVTV